MKHFDFEISQFIDGESEENIQRELFAHLTECPDCRKTLYEFLRIKNKSKKFFESVHTHPQDLVFSGEVQKNIINKNLYKTLFYIFAAASLILGSLLLNSNINKNEIQKKLDKLMTNYADLQQNYKNITDVKEIGFNGERTVRNENKRIRHLSGNKKTKIAPVRENSGTIKSDISLEAKNQLNNIYYKPDLEPDENDIQAIFASDSGGDKNKKLKKQAMEKFREEFRKYRYGDNLGTRDLLQRLTPYLKNGKISVDTAKVRDLFLRYGKDKFLYKPLDGNRELDTTKNK